MTESSQWSIKYRPATVREMVVGNPDVLKLASGISETSQALLISGASGTGKTTLARVLARELNGDEWESDLIEMDLATERGIDDIRGLKQRLQYSPKVKKIVVILDEVHAATTHAGKSLLKLLEDPPHRNILFVLCTDQPWQLSKPLLNRCRHLSIKPPKPVDLAKYLMSIAKRERVKVKIPEIKTAAMSVSKLSEGVPRLAVQMFQDACSLMQKGQSPKEATKVVSSGEDLDINRLTGSILIALYSKGKPQAAAEFIVTKASQTDGMGLLIRLQSANYYGMIMKLGGPFNWQGKVFDEALKSKGLDPDTLSILRVSTKLNEIREQLREVITDPTLLVTTELASLPFRLSGKH